MLYIRMAVIMGVSLFTSRIILEALGIQDYGVYNIVGGVVISLSFITNTLTSSTQRFLSFEIGIGAKGDVANVFSMSLNILFLFTLIVILILETLGLWFLNNILVIPPDRFFAANIVYQTSILVFCINLLRVPYNALIISTEQMDIYAIISIAEAIIKLIIAYLIMMFPDKLIAYGFLLLGASLLINGCYIIACKIKCRNYCTYRYRKDRKLFKNMFGFSGWTLVGGISGVAVNEGPNYLMNIYLGVGINAAMGIAKQVSSAVYSFTSNFQTAFNPQITKAYAANDRGYLDEIIYQTSALSFYLIMLFAVPIIVFSDYIFHLWLVEVPDYAISFSIILMSSQLISALGGPLWMVVHATGNIKKYQLIVCFFNLMLIPATWYCLFVGLNPNIVISVQLITNIAILIYRLLYLKNNIGFPVGNFSKIVIIKCVKVLILTFVISFVVSLIPIGYGYEYILLVISFFATGLVIFYVGLNRSMRNRLTNTVLRKIKVVKQS